MIVPVARVGVHGESLFTILLRDGNSDVCRMVKDSLDSVQY